MKKDKIRTKLSRLEQVLENNKYNDHFVLIPALPSETDEEAVRARIVRPESSDYNITVLRRLEAGFDFKVYDHTLKQIISHSIYTTLDMHDETGSLSKEEMRILLEYFNRLLCNIEGVSPWEKRLFV